MTWHEHGSFTEITCVAKNIEVTKLPFHCVSNKIPQATKHKFYLVLKLTEPTGINEISRNDNVCKFINHFKRTSQTLPLLSFHQMHFRGELF